MFCQLEDISQEVAAFYSNIKVTIQKGGIINILASARLSDIISNKTRRSRKFVSFNENKFVLPLPKNSYAITHVILLHKAVPGPLALSIKIKSDLLLHLESH